MVMLGMPLVVAWRPPGFAARVLALLVLGVVCGHGGLRAKQAMIVKAATEQADEKTAETAMRRAAAHNKNYLRRADSGRLRAYRELWRENQESPWFGRGLAAANKPLLYLNQEHSSILTTLRTSERDLLRDVEWPFRHRFPCHRLATAHAPTERFLRAQPCPRRL